jgi:phosphoglycolate phosphatase-like HAD superfamily hydrolase
MLVLFDIDGTLVESGGAGRAAMEAAGRELFGRSFTLDGVEIAGRLDPLIWDDAARAAGVDDPAAHHDRFRSTYARVLRDRLDRHPTVRALPGADALVSALAGVPGITLGLLTGNYPETGRLKISRARLEPDRFPIGAWGSDAPRRPDLVTVARRRHHELTGRETAVDQVVIVGDTPHDVGCATAHGCRCLAVATGRFERAELEAEGADLAMDDLTQTQTLVHWITSGQTVATG